jgi:hypothetical protein
MAVYPLSNWRMNAEEPDALKPGQVCIGLDMDSEAVLVGTPLEIQQMAERIAMAAFEAERFVLLTEEDEEEA